MDTLPTDLTGLCYRFLDAGCLTLLHQPIDTTFLVVPSNQKRLCLALKTNNYPWILYLYDKIDCNKCLGKAAKYHHDWIIKKYLQCPPRVVYPNSIIELVNLLYKYNRFKLVDELEPYSKIDWFKHTVDKYFWYGSLGYDFDDTSVENPGFLTMRNIRTIYMQGLAFGQSLLSEANRYELFDREFTSIQDPTDVEWSCYFFFNNEDFIISKIGDRHQNFESITLKWSVRLCIMNSHWRLLDILLSYHFNTIGGTEIVGWLLSVDRFDLINKYFGPNYIDPTGDEKYIINIRNNAAKPKLIKIYTDQDITNTVLYRYIVIEKDEFKIDFVRKLYNNVDLVILENHINKLKAMCF